MEDGEDEVVVLLVLECREIEHDSLVSSIVLPFQAFMQQEPVSRLYDSWDTPGLG